MPPVYKMISSRLNSITNLPTLPVVVQQLGKAIRDPLSDAQRIALIIADDQAIMARILKVVNSAFYVSSKPVTSIKAAVARMGLRSINNIALSTSVFSTFGTAKGVEFDRQAFWMHSICTGIAADVLYARVKANVSARLNKDSLHLVGLLHDLGKIILDEYFHEEFIECFKAATASSVSLWKVEQEMLGMDHAAVGAWLGSKWNLSWELIEVMRCHHQPDLVSREEAWPIVALVHAANYICNLEKLGSGGNPAPAVVPGVWKKLGIRVEDLSDIAYEIKEESKNSEIMMALMK